MLVANYMAAFMVRKHRRSYQCTCPEDLNEMWWENMWRYMHSLQTLMMQGNDPCPWSGATILRILYMLVSFGWQQGPTGSFSLEEKWQSKIPWHSINGSVKEATGLWLRKRKVVCVISVPWVWAYADGRIIRGEKWSTKDFILLARFSGMD